VNAPAWLRNEHASGDRAPSIDSAGAGISVRHEVALALFKYGVVRNPSELAVALRIPESTATELCRDLVAAALLDEVD